MIFETDVALNFLRSEAKKYCWELFQPVLEDKRFAIWSAASKPHLHHYGRGGLIHHISEVAILCAANNDISGKQIDERKLFTAAFYHDVGKMWDHMPTNDLMTEWSGTKHKRNIHHISRSALEFQRNVDRLSNINKRPDWLDQEFTDDVLHAILAHHGQRDWGSPVSPNSKLAYMLHLCDSISARMADCEYIDRVAGEGNFQNEVNCPVCNADGLVVYGKTCGNCRNGKVSK